MSNTEDLIEAQKATIEKLTDLTNKVVVAGGKKLGELNAQALQASSQAASSYWTQVLSVKNPQEWLDLQAKYLNAKDIAQNATDYSQHVLKIAADSVAQVQEAAQDHLAQTQDAVKNLVNKASQNAPGADYLATAAQQAAEAGKQALAQFNTLIGSIANNTSSAAKPATSSTSRKR